MTRTRWQGARQILSFNRDFYGRTAVAVSFGLAAAVAAPPGLRPAIALAIAPTLFWMCSSLAISHYVYDRSRLYQPAWLKECFPRPPADWVNLHAGLDETTPLLREAFPGACGRTLNLYDACEMTEPSIRHARQIAADGGERADWRALPFSSATLDAAFLIFAAHEWRRHDSRVALLREVARILRPGGTLVVAEHLRDTANFLAFGPGFLHFHPDAAWTAAAAEAGLALHRRFRITPFVHVFVWRTNL